jgi:hypothetical protein
MMNARRLLVATLTAIGALAADAPAQLDFDEQPNVNLGVVFAGRTVCTDMDGQNGPDVVIQTDDIGGFTYAVALNDGAGGFTFDTAFGGASTAGQVVAGDWDGDGLTDLLAIEPGAGDDDLAYIRQVTPGDWSFTDFRTLTGEATYLAAADLNGDKRVDLAIGNESAGTVEVFFNDGTGSILTPIPVSYAMGPIADVELCDLDADGAPDMVTLSQADDFLRVRFNDGIGNFGSSTLYLMGADPVDVLCCDVNADGFLDLAVAISGGETVTVLLNNGSGGFTSVPTVTVAGTTPTRVACGDFDCDGDVDLVFSSGNTMRGLLNGGAGTSWTADAPFGPPGASAITDVLACEFDGVAGTDLVAVKGVGVADVTRYFNVGAGCAACIVPPSDAVAWYTGGDFCTPEDALGNHDGTIVGLPFCPMAKVGGGALGIDSSPTPTYVSVPNECNLAPEDDFTVNTWVRTTAAGFQPLATMGPAPGFEFTVFDGVPRVVVCDSFNCWLIEASTIINDGDWHHVAFTLDPGPLTSVRLYVNGVIENSTLQSMGSVSPSSDLLLGAAFPPLPGVVMDGALDEFQLHHRALSAAEIQAIHLAGIAGQCADELCPPPSTAGASPDLIELVAGIPDDFALPTEPATPGPLLGSVCVFSDDFDTIADDNTVCHSFLGLPENIIAATLELRIRASDVAIPCNDTIQLQASGGPVVFEWTRRLGAPWPAVCPGDAGLLDCIWIDSRTHTFCLDLGALPEVGGGTSSVLDTMNTTDRLDVRIQDDSGVDSMRLRLAVCPCPGDATCDGTVDVTDMLDVLGDWGPCPVPCPPCASDVTGDCVVDVSDLLLVLGAWGPC